MSSLLANTKILICAGSGGVGKTTVAAALGFKAAVEGRRVLVITIDPSQRLKTTLGLNDQGETTELRHPDIKGSLSATVINSKKVFDDFVLRAAKNDERAQKILKNRLYIQLSTTLSGSQEFTALEKLYSAYESNKYDLIVVDTPPTKHAIDFIKAPQKLSALFSENITKWFRDPERKKNFVLGIIQTGTRQVLKALESLTGSEFMKELADFFLNIQSWQGTLEQRIGDVHRLLVASQTQFVVVTHFDEAKLQEAQYFIREIRQGGYNLSALIVNRAFPEWLSLSSSSSDFFVKIRNYYAKKQESCEKVVTDLKTSVKMIKIPEFSEDISDLQGVNRLASGFLKEF